MPAADEFMISALLALKHTDLDNQDTQMWEAIPTISGEANWGCFSGPAYSKLNVIKSHVSHHEAPL